MIKKFFSLLLTLCMVLAMMPVVTKPVTVQAAPVQSVRIGGRVVDGAITGGVVLDSTHKYYHNGENGGLGTADANSENAVAEFDANAGTLTLNGLNIDTDQPGIWWKYSNSGNHDLTIVLADGSENKINNSVGSGILGESGLTSGPSLTIKGSGKLSVTGKTCGIWVWRDITIQETATVIATGETKMGICNNDSGGTITIGGAAVVTATGATYGIGYDNEFSNVPVIQSGTVTMSGGEKAVMVKTGSEEASPDLSTYTKCKVSVGERAGESTEWTNSQPLKDYKYIHIEQGDHVHIFDSTWGHNETYHWQACTHAGCRMTNGYVVHNYDESGIMCSTCGYTIPVPTYSVTFDSKGGTTVTDQQIASGNKIEKPADPQKAGYTFGGWYKSGEDTKWDFDLNTVTADITLYAKWLSQNTGVTSVSVSGTAGSISGAAITVVLPYGSVIPTSASAITIHTADGASPSEPVTNDSGSTWTFSVTAEDNMTTKGYIINVSVAENPAAGNQADVDAAKSTINNFTWTVAQGTANSKENVKTWIEQTLSGMNLNGVSFSVTMSDSFVAAVAGTSENPAGTNGSFGFTVNLCKGTGDTSASESVTLTSGVITATAYSSGGGSNPGGNPGGSTGGNTGDYYIPPTTTDNDSKTETTTLPDGTKVETSTTTDKTTGATIVEEKKTALDGTVTETKTTTQKDGSSQTTSMETRTDGSTTETNTTVDTEGTAKSVVLDKDFPTGDVLTIRKTEEPNGEVSYVLATLETEEATIVKAKVERAEALANMKNIPYRVKVLDENGKLDYKVRVNTGDVKANQTLYVYKYDSKTKSFGLVQADHQKVKADEKANIICDFENLISTQRYQLVTKSKAGLLDKKILATVKAKIGQKSLKVNQSTSFKLDEKLNLENVSTIKYSTSDKQVVKVSKAGKITGKNTGTADIKATITLINGKTKTVRMKIKVK